MLCGCWMNHGDVLVKWFVCCFVSLTQGGGLQKWKPLTQSEPEPQRYVFHTLWTLSSYSVTVPLSTKVWYTSCSNDDIIKSQRVRWFSAANWFCYHMDFIKVVIKAFSMDNDHLYFWPFTIYDILEFYEFTMCCDIMDAIMASFLTPWPLYIWPLSWCKESTGHKQGLVRTC